MTKSHLLSFVCGAVAVLGINMIGQSKAEAPNHVFELRTYHAAPGKLDALHSRFRDHTLEIFKKHGMHSVGYFAPTDEPLSKNTLIYILSFPSRDAAKKSWDAFSALP